MQGAVEKLRAEVEASGVAPAQAGELVSTAAQSVDRARRRPTGTRSPSRPAQRRVEVAPDPDKFERMRRDIHQVRTQASFAGYDDTEFSRAYWRERGQ